jgi:dihydropteroate synthase
VVVIAVAALIGGVIGVAQAPLPSDVARSTLHRLWPLGIALGAQLLVVIGPESTEVLFSACALIAIIVVANSNRHLAGIVVLGLGALLNLVSLVVNGGMPVDPDALVAADVVDADEVASTDPGAARHLDEGDDPLPWLGDIVPIGALHAVVSFGDLLIAVGLVDTVAALTRRREVYAVRAIPARRSRAAAHGATPVLVLRGRRLELARPLVMGIVNASPESFSDGRPGEPLDEQVERAVRLLDRGADLVDIGGQSAITNVPELDEEEEISRVAPLIAAVVARRPHAVVSVDAYRPAVVAAALGAGASLVNDVSGLLFETTADICAREGAGLVVMHTSARPKERRPDPDLYTDVVTEVVDFLAARLEAALARGVPEDALVVDPGIDFAKTPLQSIELLRGIDAVLALGRPCLLAISRKDFIGALTGQPPRHRLAGTLATAGQVGWRPGLIYRVHDVGEIRDFLTVLGALTGEIEVPRDLRLADELRHERPRSTSSGECT